MKRIATHITSNPNSTLVFKIDEKPDAYAFVHSGDQEYKVNLTNAFVNNLKYMGKIDTILHEVSHFETDEVVGSKDIYYLKINEEEPDDIDTYIECRLGKAKHLSDSLKTNSPLDEDLIFKGANEGVAYSDLAELSMGNADHVAIMAMSLGRRVLR
jgi:hypothetical protein